MDEFESAKAEYEAALAELSFDLEKNGIKVKEINDDGTYSIRSDKTTTLLPFKDQKLNGILQIKELDSLLHEISYKDGVAEGVAKAFFPTGELRLEYGYKNGLTNGPFTSYYQFGHKQSEGSFFNGTIHGICTLFDELGDISYQCSFNNGIEDGNATAYFPKSFGGGISKSLTYKNGLKINEELSYYPTGELYERRIYDEKGYLKYEIERFNKKGECTK